MIDVQSPIGQRVLSVIASLFSIPVSDLNAETTASDVDGWDSLRHAELIMLLGEEFDIDVPLDKVMKAETVGDLVAIMDSTAAGHVSD